MGKKDDNPYHIEKLKGEKNWESYHIDLKSILIKEGLWKWASGRAKRPSYPPKPVPSEDGTAVTAAQHDHHKKEVEEWSKEVDKFDEGHEEAMAVIHLTTMPEPREHVKGYTNSEHAIAKLLKQYGTSNLATVDTSFQEICRSNMEDFPGLFEYAEHIQRHHNKILQAGKDLYPWQLSSADRMGLPSHLSPYVFPLVNAAKAADKQLAIDDMVDALAEEQRRSNYAEEKTEAARAIKNSRNRNYGNNGRKDRGQGPCNGCNRPYHDQPHCPYEFPTQRPPNWKPYELKLHLAKDWKKSDGFVPANANVKNDKKTVKKVNSHSSIASKASSTTSSSSSHATRSRMIKIKQEQKHASVKRAGKANKDPDFYLDTAADAHVCYDKSRFNYIKPPRQPKSIEVVTGDLASVEGVGSITFDLDIDGRKAINTISNVEYVPDSDYNLIATGLLCRGGYKAKHDDEGYTVTDRTIKEIFMTGSLQPRSSKGNSYILKQWGIKTKAKARKARISWTQWHRRLGHLNMKYVKRLAAMGLIDATNDPTENCESCAMGKMYRTLNRHPVRAERRATRKEQRIHTDLAGGGNIIRTPRGKRYVVIFIDDYTDYTWAYLIRHKKEFQRVLKEFILMLKAEHHDVESIRCDNAGENINKDTDALLKEHGIKWEPTVADNPHQNEVAERAFRTIFNRVRACLYDSKLPKYLWGEACHTVVYLKNRSPC